MTLPSNDQDIFLEMKTAYNNLLSRVASLEAAVRMRQVTDVEAGNLGEITEEGGDLRSGQTWYGEGDPNDLTTLPTGLGLSYPSLEFLLEFWHLYGLNAGRFQIGINAVDGKLYFQGGKGRLDELGVAFDDIGDGVDLGGAGRLSSTIYTDGLGVAHYQLQLTGANLLGSSVDNGDFETGDFTDWSTLGYVTIESADPCPGGGAYYAKLRWHAGAPLTRLTSTSGPYSARYIEFWARAGQAGLTSLIITTDDSMLAISANGAYRVGPLSTEWRRFTIPLVMSNFTSLFFELIPDNSAVETEYIEVDNVRLLSDEGADITLGSQLTTGPAHFRHTPTLQVPMHVDGDLAWNLGGLLSSAPNPQYFKPHISDWLMAGEDGWNYGAVGSGTAAISNVSEPHPGRLLIGTSGVVNSGAYGAWNTGASEALLKGGQVAAFIFTLPVLHANHRAFLGFMSDVSTAAIPATGIFLEIVNNQIRARQTDGVTTDLSVYFYGPLVTTEWYMGVVHIPATGSAFGPTFWLYDSNKNVLGWTTFATLRTIGAVKPAFKAYRITDAVNANPLLVDWSAWWIAEKLSR